MTVAISPPPASLTSLVGRVDELDVIEQQLDRDHVRLLSLTGPAGVGKTRLALEAGARLVDRFPHGVTFVNLAPVREPARVLHAIAQELGLVDNGSRPLLNRVQEYLGTREQLLILDNFEQVLPAARVLVDLLTAAPGLQILVTTRVPLRLRWERTYRINPLAVPGSDLTIPFDALLELPSVALFVDRAQAQRADFMPTEQQAPFLIQVARQLDGLPLAIELAAANMQALPLAAIVRRLERRLESLQWDAQDLPDRQRSLHAAISWSYELLTETEQRLFRHLGVFVERVPLDAIAAVLGEADADQILVDMVALAEKSLVLPGNLEDDPEPSFGMLETIRRYAHELLEVHGELDAAGQAHAHYFLDLAERAEPELTGRRQHIWYQRLEREHDNLRSALRWLLDRGQTDQALRLANALGRFWWIRGYHSEGWDWFDQALNPDADPALRTKGLLAAGLMPLYQGGFDRSLVALEEALALATERQDSQHIADALTNLGARAVLAGNVEEGGRLLNEALRRWEDLGESANGYQVGTTLLYLSGPSIVQGDLQQAAAYVSRALSRYEASGDIHSASAVRSFLAVFTQQLGDLSRAVELVREGLRGTRISEDRWHLTMGAEAALLLAGDRADPEKRARLVGAGEAFSQMLGLAFGSMGQWFGQTIPTGQDQFEREGVGAAYREGRSLSFSETADLVEAILDGVSQTITGPGAAISEQNLESRLSAREQEVLHLVASGLTSKQIGQQLFLSPRTVDHHMTSICNKLGVDTRAQAVSVAAREGIL